jgi:hypothetical protein
MVTCRYCGRVIKLAGRGLDRLWRHRKYARRSNGMLVGPAGNVCPGSGMDARQAAS